MHAAHMPRFMLIACMNERNAKATSYTHPTPLPEPGQCLGFRVVTEVTRSSKNLFYALCDKELEEFILYHTMLTNAATRVLQNLTPKPTP
jgi:hypothetical protein